MNKKAIIFILALINILLALKLIQATNQRDEWENKATSIYSRLDECLASYAVIE